MKNLEKLPKEVSEGKISVDKAALKIMETIYKNRLWFGLKKLQEDQLHDFMLFYFDRSKTVFEIYKPELGSFSSFLYGNINNALLAWTRQFQRQNIDEQSIQLLQDIVYEESAYTYEQMEPPVVCEVTDKEMVYSEKILSSPENADATYSFNRGRTFSAQKNVELRKEACLVLLLKSCFSVNDTMIEKVANISGRSFDELKELVEKARGSLKSKIKRINKIERARDNSFYFKRKYCAEKEFSDVGTEFCKLINTKLSRADKIWKEKNSKLNAEGLKVPSNVTIGKLLGMSDRHVKYIILNATKNMDNISLKSYYEDHENIFSKRKFEQKTGDGGTVPGTHGGYSKG